MPISEAYNLDRMEFLSKFPDKHFDLFVDDPPYAIGADNPSVKPNMVKQKNGKVLSVKQNVYPKSDWDAETPPAEYFEEVKRVSKHQIIWGVNYFDYDFRGGRIVWDKLNGDTDQYDCEIAYCSMNTRTDIVYYMWRGMMQGTYCGKDLAKALLQQGNKKLNEKRIHPCQKPILLYAWLLNTYAKPGFKIGDAHISALACTSVTTTATLACATLPKRNVETLKTCMTVCGRSCNRKRKCPTNTVIHSKKSTPNLLKADTRKETAR